MSIDQVILWVQNELRNAQTDLLAAEHTKDDVRFAVALRKLEALQEIETILNSVKGGDIA